MESRLNIRTWIEPFPASAEKGLAVVFDVFRCSTTIHTLKSRNIGRVQIAPSLKTVMTESRLRNARVFSELSQPVECAERFDNSPRDALLHDWTDARTALVATTTGTPAMFAARNFARVYVGSLVNFSALVTHLSGQDLPITLIPATFPEARHVEDEITAQAMATALEGFANLPDFVRQCADQARESILASGRPDFLAQKLATGREDVTLSLDIDRFPQILSLAFEPGENPLFAEVVSGGAF